MLRSSKKRSEEHMVAKGCNVRANFPQVSSAAVLQYHGPGFSASANGAADTGRDDNTVFAHLCLPDWVCIRCCWLKFWASTEQNEKRSNTLQQVKPAWLRARARWLCSADGWFFFWAFAVVSPRLIASSSLSCKPLWVRAPGKKSNVI